jgi:topoisomerase IA-like protein
MKQYNLTVNVGDIIEVGRFRNVATKIKNIKLDENGQPVIITSKGAKKLLSCRLAKLHPGSKTPKQILMEKRK